VVPSAAKVTVPVGLVVPELGLTVAVNVTGSPTLDGLSDDASAVVVFLLTLPPPQVGKLNDAILVFHATPPVGSMYSLVYQKVQSSDGSSDKLV
jgi:hypothetical protein